MTADAAPNDAAPRRPREAATRTILQVGAVTTAVGIALAVADDESLSRWLTLLGFALLVAGLHRFGRLGADAPVK